MASWQERYNQRLHDEQMAAERRALDRQTSFVMRNPNSVSGAERRMVMQREYERMAKKHALDMLEKRNQGAVDAAKNQGVGVAQINADAQLKIKEKELANQKDIAGIDAETRKYGYDKGVETEKLRGENALLTEQERQAGALEQEQERQAGALEIEKQKGKTATELQASNERIAKATATAQGNKGAMKPEVEAKLALNLLEQASKNRTPMTYEEALAKVRSDNQNGGKKEVKRQRNPKTGEIRIVYSDGSTEIVKG